MKYILFLRIDIVYYLYMLFSNICHKLARRHQELFKKINARKADSEGKE